MADTFPIINNIAVSIFGCVLSAAFCGMGRTKQSRLQIAAVTVAILLFQGIYCTLQGAMTIRKVYPLLAHLPLAVFLCCLTKRKLWACGSIFLAYLCCQIRRWLALLLILPIRGGETELCAVEFLITFPVLWLFLRYVAPTVKELAFKSVAVQAQFCLIPVLYYVYDYLTVVYTDWLYSGKPAVVEFMPFVCCAAYIAFLLHASVENQKYSALESDRNSLNLQIAQSVRELEALREVQSRTAAYRHDLRHHLQYLSECLGNGKYSQAQDYIHEINREIDAQTVVVYCENEPVNLILSAYAGRAAKAGVETDIKVILAPVIGISANDMCVLLSNALENALHACMQLTDNKIKRLIQVRGYEKDGKIYLQIINPCAETVTFKDGIPVTGKQGHGIGIRSIQAVVKRYGGICSFKVENSQFIMRVSL